MLWAGDWLDKWRKSEQQKGKKAGTRAKRTRRGRNEERSVRPYGKAPALVIARPSNGWLGYCSRKPIAVLYYITKGCPPSPASQYAFIVSYKGVKKGAANIGNALACCMPPVLCASRLRQDDSNDGCVLGKGGRTDRRDNCSNKDRKKTPLILVDPALSGSHKPGIFWTIGKGSR